MTMFNRLMAALAMASASMMSVQVSAQADDGDQVEYTMAPGDNLIALGQRYFRNSEAYREVQNVNGVTDPRRIPVGAVLKFPKSILRSVPADLSVASFQGQVEIVRGAAANAPEIGMAISEGAELRTGARSFLSLRGSRGSIVTLPSQSRVRITMAREYVYNNLLDVEFQVLQGRGELSPVQMRDNERYRVRTPYAVAAVRGTVFRVFVDPTRGQAGTEVLEGLVGVAGGEAATSVEPGFGLVASEAGLGEIEALLPAPELLEPARVQTDENLHFVLEADDQAVGYRAQVANDAGFIEVLDETLGETSELSLEGLPNGRYFVRLRAIANSGIEGLPQVYSFRRQRLGVTAGSAPSALADGMKFSWQGQGGEGTTFDFELWREGEEGQFVLNEIGMAETEIVLTDLAPATYIWRVGAVQFTDEGPLRVWGPAQRLIVAE